MPATLIYRVKRETVALKFDNQGHPLRFEFKWSVGLFIGRKWQTRYTAQSKEDAHNLAYYLNMETV